MFCPKCGIENLIDQKFCRRCGHALAGHRAALEGKFEDAVEKIQSGSTALGLSAVGVIIISLMCLGVWLGQNDAGVFFTLIPVLAFMIPATIIGLVRLTRAYRALSRPERGNKALQAGTTTHLTEGATTDSLNDALPPASVTEHTTHNLQGSEPARGEAGDRREVDSSSSAS
jgi:hypothetical protein